MQKTDSGGTTNMPSLSTLQTSHADSTVGPAQAVAAQGQTAPISSPRKRDSKVRIPNPVNSQPCQPTWTGVIEDDWDALLVVEACLQGKLQHCGRRPHDHERSEMIKSGSVFVYNSMATGIKRWTDGLNWSPSRMNGNCLMYRELHRPFPPGKKKAAIKRKRSGEQVESVKEEISPDMAKAEPELSTMRLIKSLSPEEQRVYVGSLIDSYEFKNEGLFKKTITIIYRNIIHHVVNYYSLEDVFPAEPSSSLRMRRPRIDAFFQNITVRNELYSSQDGFRIQQLPMDAGEFRGNGFCPHYSAIFRSDYANPLHSFPPLQHQHQQQQLAAASMAPQDLGITPATALPFSQPAVDGMAQSHFGALSSPTTASLLAAQDAAALPPFLGLGSPTDHQQQQHHHHHHLQTPHHVKLEAAEATLGLHDEIADDDDDDHFIGGPRPKRKYSAAHHLHAQHHHDNFPVQNPGPLFLFQGGGHSASASAPTSATATTPGASPLGARFLPSLDIPYASALLHHHHHHHDTPASADAAFFSPHHACGMTTTFTFGCGGGGVGVGVGVGGDAGFEGFGCAAARPVFGGWPPAAWDVTG